MLQFLQLKGLCKCIHFLLMFALFTLIWQDFAKKIETRFESKNNDSKYLMFPIDSSSKAFLSDGYS